MESNQYQVIWTTQAQQHGNNLGNNSEGIGRDIHIGALYLPWRLYSLGSREVQTAI